MQKLPATLPNGEPFPARDLIIFITFFVIAAAIVAVDAQPEQSKAPAE